MLPFLSPFLELEIRRREDEYRFTSKSPPSGPVCTRYSFWDLPQWSISVVMYLKVYFIFVYTCIFSPFFSFLFFLLFTCMFLYVSKYRWEQIVPGLFFFFCQPIPKSQHGDNILVMNAGPCLGSFRARCFNLNYPVSLYLCLSWDLLPFFFLSLLLMSVWLVTAWLALGFSLIPSFLLSFFLSSLDFSSPLFSLPTSLAYPYPLSA